MTSFEITDSCYSSCATESDEMSLTHRQRQLEAVAANKAVLLNDADIERRPIESDEDSDEYCATDSRPLIDSNRGID